MRARKVSGRKNEGKRNTRVGKKRETDEDARARRARTSTGASGVAAGILNRLVDHTNFLFFFFFAIRGKIAFFLFNLLLKER